MHARQDSFDAQMTSHSHTMRIGRRHALSFTWRFLKLLLAFLSRAVFKSIRVETILAAFAEIYSTLWDLAEHSISHQDFNLPSALGDGPVHKVNAQLSKLYGMPFASLSFGGSSGALLTVLTAVLPKLHPHKDIVLFDDICHQSAIGGLIFGRWKAVRIPRNLHPKHHTVLPLKLATIKASVEKYGAKRIAALILVLPSYDGFRSPSEDQKIYAFAKAHGISVIVDGAWDAMRFRQDQSENNALETLCDVWVSSPHKRGLTPSSLGCVLTHDKQIAQFWDETLDLGFRSSSVSFVDIMIAEHRLSQILSGHWDKAFAQAETAANLLRTRVTEIHPDIRCVQAEDLGAEQGDVTHILISTANLPALDARDWANTLSQYFALDVEKTTPSTLLLICGSPSHLKQIPSIISTLRRSLRHTLDQR